MIDNQLREGLESLLPEWLASQRWYSSTENAPREVQIVEAEMLRDAWPKLLWTIVKVDGHAVYQVPIGLRETERLGEVVHGNAEALMGTLKSETVLLSAYDATIDPVLGRVLFDIITDGEQSARSVRGLGAEQSNTSLVFDNRMIVKIFRRLYEGANPDLEVTAALTESGFGHVAPVMATWQRNNFDLAVAVPYLWDGSDGWKLALASVRDFLGVESTGSSTAAGSPGVRIEIKTPAEAGGDFGDEARRLGEVSGQLHVSMAQKFGASEFEVGGLIASLTQGLTTIDEAQRPRLERIIDGVRQLKPGETGRATRIHGDYHLGQTLRSVAGWYVFDFEGEPARPLSERVIPTSPIKDVTGMFRSFDYAAAAGLFEQMPADQPSMRERSYAWGERNRNAFWTGYQSVGGVGELLPPEGTARDSLMAAFELEKAIYELAYEKAYRPLWVPIPQAALRRLLTS